MIKMRLGFGFQPVFLAALVGDTSHMLLVASTCCLSLTSYMSLKLEVTCHRHSVRHGTSYALHVSRLQVICLPNTAYMLSSACMP